MLGQNTMEWVHRRLKQASGHKDIPFGGYSIILIGDFAQLQPVEDQAVYSHLPDGIESHGHTVYKLFTSVIILKEMARQAGSNPDNIEFRELLLRLRDGHCTQEDWALLLSWSPANVSNKADFEEAVPYFTRRMM